MRESLIIILMAVLLGGLCHAAEYEVVELVEIGGAAEVPMSGPMKWSPDGTRLAYFAYGYLMLADTAGNTEKVKKIDLLPRRYEWISNDDIAVMLCDRVNFDSTLYSLVSLNISSCRTDLLDQYVRRRPSPDVRGNICIDGPFVTIEGQPYYIFETLTGGSVKTPTGCHPASIAEKRWLSPDKAPSMKENHFLRWHETGLYLMTLDESDSTWLHQGSRGDVSINRDMTHLMISGILVNLLDSTRFELMPLAPPKPPETYACVIEYCEFNPVSTEVLFYFSCWGEDPYYIDHIGLFDYETREMVMLDTLVNLDGGSNAVFDPFGKNIAFMHDSKGYIVIRRAK